MSRSIVPTLASILETFAFHCTAFMTERPKRTDVPYKDRARGGMGLGGFDGCPLVLIEFCILPTSFGEGDKAADPWGPWAQVFMRDGYLTQDVEPNVYDGTWQPCGNRSGGRDAYARKCAPVIAWIAAYEASEVRIVDAEGDLSALRGYQDLARPVRG